jgi:hypothetical protein
MLTDERGKVPTLDDNSLALLVDAISALKTIGKVLHARYEAACNGDTSPDEMDDEGNDLVADVLQAQCDAVAANVGLYVYHQTDCHGAALYVSFFPIPDNDYTHAVCLS